MSEAARASTQTIERAADVLTLFTEVDGASLGVTEISKRLGLSKGVVHRILTSLRSRGFVEVHPETRRYSLGPATLALGLTHLQGIEVRELSRPVMQHLTREFRETATLSIRNGWSRIYIDQIVPPREVIMTVRLGHPFPLHAGGSSKVLLAALPEDDQDEYLAQPLASVTQSTITDPDQLRRQLAKIRKDGFAITYGERQRDAGSAAAAILDHTATAVAAISLCGPAQRFKDKAKEAAPAVREAALRISEQMGYRP